MPSMKTRVVVALQGCITGAVVLAHTETPRLTLVESAVESKVAASTTEGLSATACELPNEQKSIRLAVIGDSGTGGIEQYQLGQQMENCRAKSGFDFVLMLGDNIYGGKSPQDFERKFEVPYKPLLDAGVKFYASIGNHDDTNERLYKPFNMGGQRYYSFKKGNATFFALDSNYMDLAQLDWLERELSSTNTPWKICFMHHPLYSDGRYHGADVDLRAHLEPLFEKYGVDVVLSGHDHVYERLKPEHGIYYFVLGNSGELRYRNLRASAEMAAGFDTDRSFMVLEIAGDKLYFQTVSRAGQVVDSGELDRPQ
jgi:3',5'-cyclic AMP phosphodiesterase CpdA